MQNEQQTSPLETLCSIEEIAQACYVSTQTVRNWVERGIMPQPIRIGRRCLRWRASEIEAWLQSNQSAAPSKTEQLV
jgi:predicted DNA-binding transcriptional regulator AlpA